MLRVDDPLLSSKGSIVMASRSHGHGHAQGIANYGLVKGVPSRQQVFKTSNPNDNPHLHVLTGSGGSAFDVTIDVFSREGSEVLYAIKPDFAPAKAADLVALAAGSQAIGSGHADGLGLDYVRQQLVARGEMSLLPIDPRNVSSDLNNALGDLIARAIAGQAELYAFGTLFDDGSSPSGPNPFGLDPLQGIHNIHMNQGNPPSSHGDENGTFQDGALFVRFIGNPDSWVGVFLAFQSQSFSTDASGDPT